MCKYLLLALSVTAFSLQGMECGVNRNEIEESRSPNKEYFAAEDSGIHKKMEQNLRNGLKCPERHIPLLALSLQGMEYDANRNETKENQSPNEKRLTAEDGDVHEKMKQDLKTKWAAEKKRDHLDKLKLNRLKALRVGCYRITTPRNPSFPISKRVLATITELQTELELQTDEMQSAYTNSGELTEPFNQGT